MRGDLKTRFQDGNQAAVTHGAYSLEMNGLEALEKAELLALVEIEGDLSTRQGRLETMRRRVAMGILVLQRVETYVAEKVAEGADLDKIAVFGRWPAYQNSLVRALQRLEQMGTPEDKSRIDELKRIDAILGEGEEGDHDD